MKKPAIKLSDFAKIKWQSGPDEDGIYQVEGVLKQTGEGCFALFKSSEGPKEGWKTHKYYGDGAGR